MLNYEEFDKLLKERPNRCVLCDSLSDLVPVDLLTEDTDENGDFIGHTVLPDYYMCGIHALEYNRLSEEKLRQFDDVGETSVGISSQGKIIHDLNDFLIGRSKINAYSELLVKYLPVIQKNISDQIKQNDGGD